MKNLVKFVKCLNSWLGWLIKWDNKLDLVVVWYSFSCVYNKFYDFGRIDFKEKGERGFVKIVNILFFGFYIFVFVMGKKIIFN